MPLRKFVHSAGRGHINEKRIMVRLGRQANDPHPIKVRFPDEEQPIPLLGTKPLRLVCG